MPDAKRERQKQSRQARLAAEAAARRKAARRRQLLFVGIGAVVVVGLVYLVSLTNSDDEAEEVTAGSTTTLAAPTTAAVGSAAGKPCVPVADPLPPGAPAVPVKEGAPPTQLVTEDLKEGTGAAVTAASSVTVNYIGVACSTGKIFDSSYSRNQPASFALTQVIKGWQDGLLGMKVGGQRLLGIPSAQAYGPTGRPPDIAPDEPLWFVVEVLEAKAG